MTKFLDDFVSDDHRFLRVEGYTGDLEWYDKPLVGLTNVLITDTYGEIDLGDAYIGPGNSCGIQIVRGDGILSNAYIDYDDTFSHGKRGVMVKGPWLVTGLEIENPQIGILLMYMGSKAIDNTVLGAQEDHIRFMSGFVEISDNFLADHIDTGSKNHRDCIQGVAANFGAGKDDFLSTPITNVKIKGNICRSDDPTGQGIMFSDGIAVDWEVTQNDILVPSDHGITFNRVQSSVVRGNYTNSYINIGSNKLDANRCGGLTVRDNTAGDIRLVGGETYDCIEDFSGNKYAYDQSPMVAPVMV